MNEILEDFLVKDDIGYYCRYGDFYIDALYPTAKNIISHAHGDHATNGHKSMYATAATFAFMKNKFPKMTEDNLQVVTFGSIFTLGDVNITFFPAGHILGSAQVLMEYRGVKYLYTGDYKLQADATCE